MPPADSIVANLETLRARIAAACARVDRRPEEVRLLPVTKTVAPERLRQAFAGGCREFAENIVQEALEKQRALVDLPIHWCLIGHMQTNKAKYAARFAHEFQALDSLHLAEALEHRLQREGRGLDVFVQVNISGEVGKSGLAPDAAPNFVRALAAYPGLRPRGLMTLAPHVEDPAPIRACFRALRTLRDRLRQEPGGESLHALSMGMSGDFEIAIEEGATVVRIGQALFGARRPTN